MSTLQERLAEVFPAPQPRGLQGEIVRLCQVSRPTVSNWFRNEEKVSTMPRSCAEAICDHYGLKVSPAWLAEGKEPKYPPSISMPGAVPVGIGNDDNPDLVTVRVKRLKLRAGVSGFSVEADDDDAPPIYFRAEWLQKRGFKPYNLLATRVGGRSMETTLYDGDLVVAHIADREPKDGEVYSINYEGEPVIKRLVRDGGEWWLVSDNQDKTRYPNKRWVDGNAIIIGRIVHRQSERI